MNKEVERRIAKCKATKSENLDLSYCDLQEIPAQISKIHWLKTLYLSSNQITDLSPLADLNSLTKLDLRKNQITDLSPLADLNSLTKLDLSSNQITDLSPLADLKSLTTLGLSANQITDLSPLAGLNSLTRLYLSSNQITDLSSLADLKDLLSLNLSSNQITDLSPLADLKSLSSLDLTENQITDLSPLADLKSLSALYLRSNQITDLSPLAGLNSLTRLYLSSNQITDLSPLADLKDLSLLDLRSNQITDLSPLLAILKTGIKVHAKAWSRSGILIGNNPLPSASYAAAEKGSLELINYLQQLNQQGAEKLYELKMLLLGHGGSGKTTLMEKLRQPTLVVPNDEAKATIGVQIRQWQINHQPQNITAHIWDFGGQEIQLMTHQFFLTPQSFYIVVADNREQGTDYDYWFSIIRQLSRDKHQTNAPCSPVLVVLNENKHGSVTDYDHDFYNKKYPELNLQYTAVDFKDDDQFSKLNQLIQERICQMPQLGQQIPALWPKIKTQLNQKKAQYKPTDEGEIPLYPHIPYSEFAQICHNNGLTNANDQATLIRHLNHIGFLLYFEDTPVLKEMVFLHPQWAAQSAYFILKDKQVEDRHGIFTRDLATELLQKQSYKIEEINGLLQLLEKDHFEVCFKADCNNGTFYYAPKLMKNNEPPMDWRNQDLDLRMRYQYGFMPKGLIHHLIVRMSDYHYHRPTDGKPEVWRMGMVLYFKHEACFAMIKFNTPKDTTDQIIDIEVQGKEDNKKGVMEHISLVLDNLNNERFKNLAVEKKIPCNCNECKTYGSSLFYHKYTKLQKRLSKGYSTVECDQSGDDVLIEPLLNGNFTPLQYAKFLVQINQKNEELNHQRYLNENLNREVEYSKRENQNLNNLLEKLAGKNVEVNTYLKEIGMNINHLTNNGNNVQFADVINNYASSESEKILLNALLKNQSNIDAEELEKQLANFKSNKSGAKKEAGNFFKKMYEAIASETGKITVRSLAENAGEFGQYLLSLI